MLEAIVLWKPPLDDEKLIRFRDLLQARCGLNFTAQNYQDLEDGLAYALDETGQNADQYYLNLLRLPTEDLLWRRLLNRVTIGETYFFRTMPHFVALRERILPTLIDQRRKSGLRILRIWSAGCSTGEEPYSLAILLHELIPDIDQWHISILGTDINHHHLEVARRAVYGENAFRLETPYEIQKKYFSRMGHIYTLVPEIRQMVHFGYLNLIEDIYPSLETDTPNLDLIFCRNVTIYFRKETTRQVVKRFYDALTDGGWLFVGHSEPLASIYTDYETHNFADATLYRKTSKIKNETRPVVQQPIIPSALPKVDIIFNTLEDIDKLLEKGQVAEARDALREYIRISPHHADALFLLAKLNADEGEVESTHQLLDTIEKINPLMPQAHYLRALVFEQSTALEQAKSALRRAIYADRHFVLAHYHMGELLFSEGNLPLAKRSWQMAYNMLADKEPNNPVPYGDGATVGTLLYAIKQRMDHIA